MYDDTFRERCGDLARRLEGDQTVADDLAHLLADELGNSASYVTGPLRGDQMPLCFLPSLRPYYRAACISSFTSELVAGEGLVLCVWVVFIRGREALDVVADINEVVTRQGQPLSLLVVHGVTGLEHCQRQLLPCLLPIEAPVLLQRLQQRRLLDILRDQHLDLILSWIASEKVRQGENLEQHNDWRENHGLSPIGGRRESGDQPIPQRGVVQWHYTQKFDKIIDPDGEDQIDTEEAIAFHLYNHRDDSVLDLADWIIKRVVATFGGAISLGSNLSGEVQQFLAGWRSSLEDSHIPGEEEAGQVGRDVLLLVLRTLHPEYVERAL